MVIVDKNKEYWGAITRRNGNIESIQIVSENSEGIYEVFKTKRKVTFITNADTISIDGIGQVGINIELWEGSYNVTFSKAEYMTETIRITVEEDMTVTKNLIRSQGLLNIISSPAGATVFINNVNKGVTPLSLSSFGFGSYVVSLTKANYQTDTFNISFNTHPQTVSRNLTPTPAPAPDPPAPVIPDLPPSNPQPYIYTGPGITNITKNSAKFGCTPGRATSLEIYLNNNLVTVLPWSGSETQTASYQFNGLKAATTYSVKAIARNQYGNTASYTWTFKTLK